MNWVRVSFIGRAILCVVYRQDGLDVVLVALTYQLEAVCHIYCDVSSSLYGNTRMQLICLPVGEEDL